MAAMSSVAFFGLGTMGSGMAASLCRAGFPVTVWNRNPDRAAPLRELGATVAASPREAAAGADVAISMVADDPAARAVWMGEAGALASLKSGAVLIESSTISPEWIEDLNRAATPRGCALLDAPVTGSRVQAETGDLRFLVGGDAATLERARPILSAMGKVILHFGPLGSGACMKLVNNFICGTQAAALAEGMALIERAGLDRTQALTVLTEGAPGSPLVKAVSARMAAKDYKVNFRLGLMRKDLTYAINEGRRRGLGLNTARTALDMFETASGWTESDFSAVVEPLREK